MSRHGSDVRHGTPVNIDCGDVFEINGRHGEVIWTRQLVGSIAKTTQASDRDTCSISPRWYAPVGDGTFIAVCQHHLEVVKDD